MRSLPACRLQDGFTRLTISVDLALKLGEEARGYRHVSTNNWHGQAPDVSAVAHRSRKLISTADLAN